MSAGKGRSRLTGQKATEHHRQPTSLCQIDGCHNGSYGLSLLQVLSGTKRCSSRLCIKINTLRICNLKSKLRSRPNRHFQLHCSLQYLCVYFSSPLSLSSTTLLQISMAPYFPKKNLTLSDFLQAQRLLRAVCLLCFLHQ